MKLLRILLIAIVVLVVAGLGVGWILTYQTLGDTEVRLDKSEADVAELQLDLQDTQDDLSETQNELQDTSASLSETQNELAKQINETNKYLDLYEESRDELQQTEEELELVNEDLFLAEQRIGNLEDSIAEIQEQLDLYIDTLGTQVFSSKLPPYNYGYLSDLELINNVDAVNPTWLELRAFLQEDDTDKNLYIDGVYMCGSFAEDLHNNAETAGIRAAFVVIHFYNAPSHAVNAFKTVDQGLVYIDVTGHTSAYPIPHLDKKVVVEKDVVFRGSFIIPSGWIVSPTDWLVESIEIYW